MATDEQQQELLGALEALGGSAGNGRLRELLGWDEASYDAVSAFIWGVADLLRGDYKQSCRFRSYRARRCGSVERELL
jgi:hypothetical protein